MKNIPPLYHWSPTVRRDDVRRDGLVPFTAHRNGTPTVCLATTPAEAWALSGQIRPDVYDWDLWQVHVADTPVHRVRHWGRLCEYRIPRRIEPRGIVWVAERTGRAAGARP